MIKLVDYLISQPKHIICHKYLLRQFYRATKTNDTKDIHNFSLKIVLSGTMRKGFPQHIYPKHSDKLHLISVSINPNHFVPEEAS